MMNIREQIQTLRYWASADQDDGDLSSCDNEIADTMEKMLNVVEVLSTHSHVCGGRDCIGYLIPGDSATQYRCEYCTKIRQALAALNPNEKE